MSIFSRFFTGPQDDAASAARQQEWMQTLTHGDLPQFVKARLADTASGKLPWVTTASPAGLMAQRAHGIRPLGLVSGNCWFHYGYSWTRGHYDGWHLAIDRLRLEAALMGANAVVDVTMQIRRMPGHDAEDQMDYGVIGTAVRIDGLPESSNPALATVSALEFARLLQSGVVPVGIAIGAHYDWLMMPGLGMGGLGMGGMGMVGGMGMGGLGMGGLGMGGLGSNTGAGMGTVSYWNQELPDLSRFMTQVRRQALQQLRDDGLRIGSGILAHTQHSEIYRLDADQDNPPRFLARHIAFGTAVLHDNRSQRPFGVRPVMNVRDTGLLESPDTTKEVI
jgi:uncharacterized protein YbjQ (UPF0145 family)